MGLWYHAAAPGLPGRQAERRGGSPAVPMTPEPNDVEQSVRRVRRGCMFMAVIVAALGVLLTAATEGNLFYLITLLLVALAMVVVSRIAR